MPSAASLLVGAMLISQVLGFLRTKLVNANFPDKGPQSTDVYFAAFKIPDFFFYVLAAGVLGVVLIPILSERMQKHDRKGVWALSSSLMNLMAVVTFVVGIIIIIFAESLIHIVAPNLSAEQLSTGTTILRFIAFNPLFFTISGILTSTQQVFGRFFFFALAPVVYNASIIVSAIVFSTAVPDHNGGPWQLGLAGLGLGAMIGGILQLLVAAIGVIGLNFQWRPIIRIRGNDFKRIMFQLPARSLDQGVDSINSIVETNRARLLGDGAVTAYESAFMLHTAPILLIGSSISTAAFPRLTERIAQGRTDLFRRDFIGVLRALMWIAIPIMIIAYFCRGYLARITFTKGSPEIALILGLLSVAIFFRILYTLLSRYFYAHKDTVTPLIVSVFAILLNIILVVALAREDTYGAAGLGIAQSIVSGSEVLILMIVIAQRDRLMFGWEFWRSVSRLISITGFTILTAFIMITLLPLEANDRGFFVLGFKLGSIAMVTFLVHIAVSAMFGVEEAFSVLRRVKKVILLPVRIQ